MVSKAKLTFVTKDVDSGRKESMTCTCFDGRAMIQFSNAQQGQVTFERMKRDEKKVIYSRGVLIQPFAGKSYKEIAEIMKQDAVNGVEFTNKTSKRKIVIDKQEIEYFN